MEKKMVSVCTRKEEERKELPLTHKVETKEMQTEIQKCLDSNLDAAVSYMWVVSCQNRRPSLRMPELNNFHFTIQSLLVLQNTGAPVNALYSLNSINRVERFFKWKWILTLQWLEMAPFLLAKPLCRQMDVNILPFQWTFFLVTIFIIMIKR